MGYAVADPFAPHESDSSRVLLGWARARYEFSRRFVQPDFHVVDAGFGARILSKRCRSYTGIDTSEVVRAVLARGRYTDTSVRFLPADLDLEFPILPERANLIHAFEVIEHLAKPRRFLENARAARADKSPSPILLLSTPLNSDGAPRQKSDHLQEYSRPALEELLQQSGFRVEEVWSWGSPFGRIARKLAKSGKPLFRQDFDRGRSAISRFADWLPGLARVTYFLRKYGRWGDWGVTIMLLVRPSTSPKREAI